MQLRTYREQALAIRDAARGKHAIRADGCILGGASHQISGLQGFRHGALNIYVP